MASYCDQKYLLKQNHIDIDDQLVRDRSSTMPSSSTKENVAMVKRRTIFDPIYDVFSPEENTSDYLEDYIEKLGEYHVHRDTRHLHLHTPLQFGANSEKNLALCPVENTSIEEKPKRNQECSIKVENRLIKEGKTITDGTKIDEAKAIKEQDSAQFLNRSGKRSFQLQELKICNSNIEKQNKPSSAPISSSQIPNVMSTPLKSKEGPKSINAIKTLSSKKIHVDAPKPIEKGFSVDLHKPSERLIETTPKNQKNANKISQNPNIMKSTRDISCKPPKELSRGMSTEGKSPQMGSKVVKPPKPQEMDSIAMGTSEKRLSVAQKTSPKPARKGPKSKSTMHSFFEAFM